MSLGQFSTALLFSQKLKQERKDIKIIFGGAFTKKNSKKIIEKYEFVDFVLKGQAYLDFSKLIKCIITRDYSHINEISGLFYRKGKRILFNYYKEPAIEKMPIPDFLGLPLKSYTLSMDKIYKNKFNFLILKYILSLGCSYAKCTFCNRYQFEKFDLKSPSKIVNELNWLSRKYKTKLFSLECEMINQDRNWLYEICDKMIKSNLSLKWYAYGRSADLDEETFKLLRDSGNLILRWGIESGSQRVLDKMNEGYSVNEIEKILRWSFEANIWNHVNIIVGFPGETEENVNDTINFIKKNSRVIDSIKINPFYINLQSHILQCPHEYNITISEYKLDNIRYIFSDNKWKKIGESEYKSIKNLCRTVINSKISFVGSIFDILFPTLCYFKDKNKTKLWLNNTHPYFLKCYPTFVLLQKLYYPQMNKEIDIESSWKKSVGKGGGSTDNLEILEKMNFKL